MKALTDRLTAAAAIALAGLFLLLSAPALQAQEISAVRFEQQSGYKFSEDMLKFNVQTRKGLQYDEKTVNEDIKRLHATGFFSDVVAETQKGSDGKLVIVFKIKAKPVVKAVLFQGNKKFETEKIKEGVTVAADAPLNDEKLKESAAALRKFYADKGYNDATVTPRIEDAGGGQVNVVFAIDERLRLKVDNVTFEGNTVYSSGDLKDVIATRWSILSLSCFFNAFDAGLLNREELEKDVVRLREHYWEKGYLDFKVKETRVTPSPADAEKVDVHFVLEEGQPYTVGKVSISGNKRFPDEEIGALLEMKTGETFDSRVERGDCDRIEAKYSPLGYADLMCRGVRYPDFQKRSVDVQYDIVEGGVFTIRDIFISGNKVTKDYVIRRELPIAPGDPVDKSMLKVSKERLMGMGYFKEVETVSVNSGEPAKKDVDIKVKEDNFLHFRIGGLASDTEGIGATSDFTHSNFDLLHPEDYFSGGGQRLSIGGMFGTQVRSFAANFTEPWLFGIPLKLDVSGYWKDTIYQNWSEQRIGGTASLTKKFYDDFTSAKLGYTLEQVDIHRMDGGMSQIFQSETGRSWVSKVHLTLDRDTRDNANDPTAGYDINLFNAITSKVLGASNNYYQIEGKGIQYYTPEYFKKLQWPVTFSGGGKMGSMTMLQNAKDNMVPIYERYFLGGGDSIRGFPTRGVGPVDYQGMNYGGQSMYLLTGEMTHPIYSFVRGAVFVDAGDVQSARFGAYNNLNIGAGYGLRIKLPMVAAPIKLDLAYPIVMNQENCRKTVRFHFNMGFNW